MPLIPEKNRNAFKQIIKTIIKKLYNIFKNAIKKIWKYAKTNPKNALCSILGLIIFFLSIHIYYHYLRFGRIVEKIASSDDYYREVTYKWGKECGIERILNKDKILVAEYPKEKGVINGTAKKYYVETGSIMEEIPYKDNEINGEYKKYSILGNIEKVSQYKNNKLDGEALEYYDSGEKKSVCYYSNGNLEGVCTVYYKNGQVKQEEIYNDNKLNGVKKEYAENGTLIKETSFGNGLLDGDSKIYFDNGSLKVQTHYSTGKENGEKSYYDENGEKKYSFIMENGLCNKVKVYQNNEEYILPWNSNSKSLALLKLDVILVHEENIDKGKDDTRNLLFYAGKDKSRKRMEYIVQGIDEILEDEIYSLDDDADIVELSYYFRKSKGIAYDGSIIEPISAEYKKKIDKIGNPCICALIKHNICSSNKTLLGGTKKALDIYYNDKIKRKCSPCVLSKNDIEFFENEIEKFEKEQKKLKNEWERKEKEFEAEDTSDYRLNCMEAIEKKIKYKSKAKFGWRIITKLMPEFREGEEAVGVVGNVEVMNVFGTMIPKRYTCIFSRKTKELLYDDLKDD